MAVSSTWMLSLKFGLISVGLVSIAMMMKFSVPLIVDFFVYEIPVIWSTLVSWLRPPYLYVIINGIIITIAASSRFHYKLDEKKESEPSLASNAPPPPDLRSDFVISAQPELAFVESPAVYERETVVAEVKTVVMDNPKAEGEDEEEEEEEAFVISRSTWTPLQRIDSGEIETDSLLPTPDKPLLSASARFSQRKPLKSSPEGGRLRVAKPRRHETLENTWKAITDGRHMPLTRHLKKSDTLENYGRQFNTSPLNQSPQVIMKKSETFRDRTNFEPASPANSSPSSGKIRREPSLGQDELNRRVEAFIRKFNEEMRLQRQESLNQYVEMVNRGAH